MNVRKTKPVKGNRYYNTKAKGGWSSCIVGKPTDAGCNVLSNCVGYACGRFNEIIGKWTYSKLNCNAEKFIQRAKTLGLEISDVPTLGGIMVWQKGKTLNGSDGVGHVAIVERLDSANKIMTSESSYGGRAFYNAIRRNTNKRWGAGTKYKFLGCVVNPKIGKVVYWEPWDGTVQVKTVLNIRSGPGTNYSKTGVYRNGTKIHIEAENNGWGKTYRGWVDLTYVKK